MLTKKEMRKLSRFMGKLEKKLKKVIDLSPFFSIGLGFTLAIFAFIRVSMFLNEYSIKWQIPLRSPVVIVKKPLEQVRSPLAQVQAKEIGIEIPVTKKPESEKEIVLAQKHGVILWKIYQLETERGKTDWCRLNGLGFGGFGVKVKNLVTGKSEIYCYPTFEKAVERAEFNIVKLGIDDNLIDTLCVWNLGFNREYDVNGKEKIIPHTNCKYYQDFLTVPM